MSIRRSIKPHRRRDGDDTPAFTIFPGRTVLKREIIAKLHGGFEDIVQVEADSKCEFWFARDLQGMLGYATWRNFETVVEKAQSACHNAGYAIEDHFARVSKMVGIGSGAEREIDDYALNRYACYLIAQNGDPKKPEIAFAQTYFAVQTRRMELIEQRLDEVERLAARKQLAEAESELSGLVFERGGDDRSIARIRSHGDNALFGIRTQAIKNRLGLPPKGKPLADVLPTITLKAKDFATEVTNFNIRKDDLQGERPITREHVKNNAAVRDLLIERGIKPEELPAEEDIKKVERRVESETKKLPNKTDKLGG